MSETNHTNFSDFQSPNQASVDRLIEAVDRAYHRPWLMLWRSFLQGFMTAVGATLGSIIIITVIGYLFQLKGGIELFRPALEKLQAMIIPKELRTDQSTNILQQLPSGYFQPTSTPTPTSNLP